RARRQAERPRRGGRVHADERQRGVVLGLVEERRTFLLLDGGDAGEFGFLPVLVVVVPAQVERPRLAGFGPAAGAEEVGPRDAALDRPALVDVVALVEGAAELHLRVDVEGAGPLLHLEVAEVPLREERIE